MIEQVKPCIHNRKSGFSPYNSISSFAGDPLFIDPETLFEQQRQEYISGVKELIANPAKISEMIEKLGTK